MALHPDFASNRFVYLYYTTTQNGTHNRISRFTADAANPNVAEAGSEVPIVDLPALSGATNHNGGAMNFGLDGKLYVAVGDNANSAKAQDLNDPFGKMLRFNDDGSIPADNPYCNTPATLRCAVWARGLRNPFTFAVQPGTGRMHINDVGQNTWEEINLGVPGANYGWPATEGPDQRRRRDGAAVRLRPRCRLRRGSRAASSPAAPLPAARSIRRPARSRQPIAAATTSRLLYAG